MEELSKNINSIENNIAKYIYRKYIITPVLPTPDIQIPILPILPILTISTQSTQLHIKNKANKIFNIQYKLYLQTIFNFDRTTFRITQEDVIKQDYKQMSLSNKAYNFNKTNFNPREYEILPDILRCKFIRKYKHRYYRCLNKCIQNIPIIINENDEQPEPDDEPDDNPDDDRLCHIHETCYNLYLDKYNELLKLYIDNNITNNK